MTEYLSDSTNDLMMAVVIASTTLIGLTGVVIGQIRASKLLLNKRRLYSGLLSFLPIATGLFAIVSGLVWFSNTSSVDFFVALVLFMAQIGSFWFITIWFWLFEEWK